MRTLGSLSTVNNLMSPYTIQQAIDRLQFWTIGKTLGKRFQDQWFYRRMLSMKTFSPFLFDLSLKDDVSFTFYKKKYLNKCLDHYGIPSAGLTLKERISLYQLLNGMES